MTDTLVTDELTLRPWQRTDIPALVAAGQDADLRRWLTTPLLDEADAERWVQTQQDGWTAGTRYGFAVVAPEGLVGHATVKDLAPGRPTAEVGYWTAAHARGRAIAPRALTTLTTWTLTTFGPAGLQRLDLLHQEDNQASCRVAEKSGYPFSHLLPATPPDFPRTGHVHVRPAVG
ncbi:GNAT family N-acetyltransferase [Kitasatospora sp. LaBMicrA B282]|uniref:GNAT family N-acetyltransferase n=1 Tax=Kitasatospora sp. LaBMicrA B282 TaxID=3420949 RepID=UPI003D12E37B